MLLESFCDIPSIVGVFVVSVSRQVKDFLGLYMIFERHGLDFIVRFLDIVPDFRLSPKTDMVIVYFCHFL